MKIALFVVGEHLAGKTTTISTYFKKRVGIPETQNTFNLRSGASGFIYSQSFEECGADVDERLKLRKGYDILVIPARPRWEVDSKLESLIAGVRQYRFTHQAFFIPKGLDTEATYYEHQALAMHTLLVSLFP
jgi:hypothetical protein